MNATTRFSCAPRWQRWLARLGVFAVIALVAVLSFSSSTTVNGTPSLLVMGAGVGILGWMLSARCDPPEATSS